MTTTNFPLDPPLQQLVVRIGAGSVTVETRDDLTEATVELDGGKHGRDLLAQTAVERRGGALVVIAPRQGGVFAKLTGRGVNAKITVPSGIDVKITTFTAPIWIAGRVGSADLAFGSGEAKVREVDGDLRLRCGSGLVQAVRVHGSVHLRSGSGNAEFGEIDGGLVSGCGSGDVQVRVVHGPVRVRTGSGDARLERVHGDVDATTGSGQVEIGLPSGMTARLDAHAGSGHVRSELPVENSPAAGNGTPITLRARTGSGDVRIFRAA